MDSAISLGSGLRAQGSRADGGGEGRPFGAGRRGDGVGEGGPFPRAKASRPRWPARSERWCAGRARPVAALTVAEAGA
jgi:hypothetical protein